MYTNRIIFIDYCKAMAIILVLLGHYNTVTTEIREILYSFHMPLFFFLSGFLFKRYDWRIQLKKMKDSIIIPLFFFIFFTYITLYVPRNIIHNNYIDLDSFIRVMIIIPIKEIIIGRTICDNVSLWFIYSLILCFITIRLLPKQILYNLKKYFFLFLIIVPLISTLWCKIFVGELPWNFQRHCVICCFFIIGYISNYYYKKNNYASVKNYIYIVILILSFIIYLFIYSKGNILQWHNYTMSIVQSYQTYLLSLLGILIFTILSILFAFFFGRNKYIEFISNNTYTIFATEFIWQWNLHRLELITDLELSTFDKFVIRFALACIFAYIMNKYFPKLIGKKYVK